jgi:hypothetical protein
MTRRRSGPRRRYTSPTAERRACAAAAAHRHHDTAEVLDNWTSSFPSCDPIAHQLRSAFPDRWVRFHSLANAKRYPESEREYQALLDRHTAVVEALARPDEDVVLLTTEFSDLSTPSRIPADWPDSTWWRSLSVDGSFWHVYAANVRWKPHLFDGLIRRVADDVTGNVMICHSASEWLIHPYDGGMDVILGWTASRNRLRERFKDWLSLRTDGL